jgi:hypothetical protein
VSKRFFSLLTLVLALVIFVGCSDDDDPTGPGDTISNTLTIDATSYTDWVYFSFSEDAIITVVDPMASNAWDLAFLRNHFRTNSGMSGNAMGGVIDMGNIEFATIDEAPETGFAVDDSVMVLDQGSMPPQYIWVAGSSVLDSAFVVSDNMPPTVDPTDRKFVLKTGDGMYVKLWFRSYYDAEANSGYVRFDYEYQPDGGRMFD